jgi:hypothetical protein
LVVVIIILFTGVGIQPAFAVNTSASISDGEDDCEICPSIKKIKSLVDKKENKKLSDIIDEHFDRYSNLKHEKNVGDFRPICGILNLMIMRCVYGLMVIERIVYTGLVLKLIDIFPVLIDFIIFWHSFKVIQLIFFYKVANILNCDIYY